MNFDNFDKKMTQLKLGKIIHHLESHQHKHHYELLSDIDLNNIKKTISTIDIKSQNKRKSIQALEDNNIDELIKILKRLKTDVGLN